MELDGYNKRHAVAFEFQGPAHYLPFYGKEALARTKRNDNRKRCLCRYHGVTLIHVPYWKKDVRSFIKEKLETAGVKCQ